MIMEYYAPDFRRNMEAGILIATVIVIMDTGTSEAAYLLTCLRFLGSALGVALGLVIQTIETSVLVSGSLKLSSTGLLVLRLITLSPLIYACVHFMAKYPRYVTVFLVTAINCPAVVLSQRSQAALSVVIGTIFGSMSAIITSAIFDRSSSESYLTSSCAQTMRKILSLLQLGLDRSQPNDVGISTLKEEIQGKIIAGRHTYKQYATWRSWTCRETSHDFGPFYDVLSELFYRSSLLTVKEDLDESLYYFYGLVGAPIRSIVSSIEMVKTKIEVLLDHDLQYEKRLRVCEDLITKDYQDGIILHFDNISETVQEFGMNDSRYYHFLIELQLAIIVMGKFIEILARGFLEPSDHEYIAALVQDSYLFLTRSTGSLQIHERGVAASSHTQGEGNSLHQAHSSYHE